MRARSAPAAWRFAVGVSLVIVSVGRREEQVLPSEPTELADGGVVLGGHVAGTFSVPDDDGFFNYIDYNHNALRLFRMGVTGMASTGDSFAVLGELITENFDTVQAYALYGRIRPWPETDLDIQVAGARPPSGPTDAARTRSGILSSAPPCLTSI